MILYKLAGGGPGAAVSAPPRMRVTLNWRFCDARASLKHVCERTHVESLKHVCELNPRQRCLRNGYPSMFSLSPRDCRVPWAQPCPRGMTATRLGLRGMHLSQLTAGVRNTVINIMLVRMGVLNELEGSAESVLRATATTPTCAPSTATQSTVIAVFARLRYFETPRPV